MNGIVAYFLLYISTAFYCGLDTGLKDRLNDYPKNSTLPPDFRVNKLTVNPLFNFECEAFGCLTKILKLFNEKGEMIEDGWVSGMSIISGNNATIIDSLKKKLNKCLPETNQKLSNSAPTKCIKYRIGFQLLTECVDKIEA